MRMTWALRRRMWRDVMRRSFAYLSPAARSSGDTTPRASSGTCEPWPLAPPAGRRNETGWVRGPPRGPAWPEPSGLMAPTGEASGTLRGICQELGPAGSRLAAASEGCALIATSRRAPSGQPRAADSSVSSCSNAELPAQVWGAQGRYGDTAKTTHGRRGGGGPRKPVEQQPDQKPLKRGGLVQHEYRDGA